jgi:AraC-like DNA-binding protein
MSNRLIRPNEQVVSHTDFLRMRLIRFHQTTLRSWPVKGLLSPFWRLYCNLDDGAVITSEGRRIPMAARCLYMVPAWVQWSGTSLPEVRHIYAHFDLPGMTCSLSRAAFPRPIQIHPRRKTEQKSAAIDLASQFEELGAAHLAANAVNAPDPFLVCWAKGLVYLAMRDAFEGVSPEIRARCLQPGTGTHPLVRVLNMIDTNLHQELRNDDLAGAVPCSRSHLVRIFRAVLGVAPARYIAERRISRAAELLIFGEDSLEQIADTCGFPNRHYFTRVFTRILGMSPARYRKISLLAGRSR